MHIKIFMCIPHTLSLSVGNGNTIFIMSYIVIFGSSWWCLCKLRCHGDDLAPIWYGRRKITEYEISCTSSEKHTLHKTTEVHQFIFWTLTWMRNKVLIWNGSVHQFRSAFATNKFSDVSCWSGNIWYNHWKKIARYSVANSTL